MGIRAGLPAPSGSTEGLPWIRQFLGNCSEITGEDCVYDFVTLHWYGNFEGLASHIGEYVATFPGKSIWVTEYNLDHAALRDNYPVVLQDLGRVSGPPTIYRTVLPLRSLSIFSF